MTIASLDRELRNIVEDKAIYGIECIVNALVRASIDKLSKEELITIVEYAYFKEDIMHGI